jgi:diguanylate cyclase (GGDEF)-like protein
VKTADGTPQYLISVINDLTERKHHEQRIEHMARHDPLTDLPNRDAFNDCIASTIGLAAGSRESFALLCMDLDRFKAANDVFGHAVGDALLREVGRRLASVSHGAFVARLGGDEFAVITPTGMQPAAVETLAERLSAALDSDIEINGNTLRVGATIGIGIYPQDGADAATLIANADAALFRAKAEMRGSIRFFEISMDKQLRERRALQQDLRSASAHGELALHYQPQAHINGDVTGFEALVRWHHPRHGLVPPGTFIPLAEESGLIISMGEWILRTACREAASWPRPLHIAINLSPVQFQHGDLSRLVHQVLLETGLAPSRLELEITEGVLIGDFTRAVAVLRRLKALGVRIAMDDFGTGYSSLSYLQSFPFDKIKIDQAFVANLGHSQQAATIIRAVIALGRGLNLPVVAEGVETEEQRQFLASEHCNEIQGYIVGRPQPIDEYAEAVGRAPRRPRRKPLAAAG